MSEHTTHEYIEAVKENGRLKEEIDRLRTQLATAEARLSAIESHEEEVFAKAGLPWPVHSRSSVEMAIFLFAQAKEKIHQLESELAKHKEQR